MTTPFTLSRRALLTAAGGAVGAASIGPSTIHAHATPTTGPEVDPQPIRIHCAKWAFVPVVAAAPVIDGNLAEPAWDSAAPLSDFRATFTDEPVADGPSYRIAIHGDRLYLGGTVDLADRAAIAHIEVLISTSAAGNDHFVVVIPVNAERPLSTEWDRSVVPRLVPSRTTVDQYGFALADDVAAGRLGIEVSVPLASLGDATPEGEWRINIVHIHNVDTHPMVSWYPIRTGFFMDREGEEVSYSLDVVNDGRLGSLMFGGSHEGRLMAKGIWSLEWTGFTTKRVLWRQDENGAVIPRGNADTAVLQLDWKQGADEWQRLSDVSADLSSSELSARFTHPPTAARATYQLRISMTAGRSAETVLGILSFDREDLVAAGEASIGIDPVWPTPTIVAADAASEEVANLIDLVPPRTGFRYVGLPEDPDLLPDGSQLFDLSADARSLVSRSTGTIYPNPNHPETESVVVTGRDGSEVSYPYHVDDSGRQYFLTGHLHQVQKSFVRGKLVGLAQRDPLGAARVLHRFAEVYQSWAPTTDAAWYAHPMSYSSGFPFNYWGGMWGRWWPTEVTSLAGIPEAYGIIKNTNAFDVLSDELGVDVEDLVLNRMLVPSFEHSWSFPVGLGNQDGAVITAWSTAGRAMGRPDYVHRAVAWLRDFGEQRFMADGFFYQIAASYHRETLAMIRGAITALDGYTDPVGYVSPRTGMRFDDLDIADQFPVLAKADRMSQLLAYPNGKTLPVQDTWAASTVETDLDAGTVLLPAAGLVRMTRGDADDQAQLYLHFTPKRGHGHRDPLTITMFAGGQELLPDIGYTYTRYRYASVSTIGHNTVVVDGADGEINGRAADGGNLERMWVSDDALVQAVRARQQNAYPSIERYVRELWWLGFGDDDPDGYLVDVFRVRGGARHEYVLSGDANRDSFFETWLDRGRYGDRLLPPGVIATEGTAEDPEGSAEGHYPGYIYVKEVDQLDVDQRKDYHLTVSSYGGGEQTNLSIMATLESGDNQLFLGEFPSLRTTRLLGRTMDLNDPTNLAFTLPKLVHRRDGSNLDSTFVTALESFGAATEPRVEAIDRLALQDGPDGAMAVMVCHGSVTDLLVSNPAHPAAEVKVAGITMRGEWGLVRLVDGAITQVRLLGGTELTMGDLTLNGSGILSGRVLATRQVTAGDEHDVLVVDQEVPADAAGCFVIVTHPDGNTTGYPVATVTSSDGQSQLVLADEDPGFIIHADGTSEQTAYPARRWPATGGHTFTMALPAQWSGPAIALTTATGVVSGAVVGPDGLPLADVDVHVTGRPSLHAVSGVNGSFTIGEVPVGIRHVTASRPGYRRGVSPAVVVTDDSVVTVEVQLPAESPPTLTGVDGPIGAGQVLTVTSSIDADLCLVPEGTLPRESEIRDAAQSSGVVVAGAQAGVAVSVPTEGLTPGTWSLFGISSSGGVSAASQVTLLPTDLAVIEDSDPYCSYTGTWNLFSRAEYHGGTVRRGQSVGAAVEILFHGSSATVLGSRSVNNGEMEAHLDGELIGTVDTYAPSNQFQQVLLETGPLDSGIHVLRLVATGEKSVNANNAWLTFDALLLTH